MIRFLGNKELSPNALYPRTKVTKINFVLYLVTKKEVRFFINRNFDIIIILFLKSPGFLHHMFAFIYYFFIQQPSESTLIILNGIKKKIEILHKNDWCLYILF